MKNLLISICFGFVTIFCPRKNECSTTNYYPRAKKIIALQPLDGFKSKYLESLQKNISKFYKISVIILPPLKTSNACFNVAIKEYSADSIVSFLSTYQTKEVSEIVGLTHNKLYAIKNKVAKPGSVPYFDDVIFGLGYQPGIACVVSDARVTSNYDEDNLVEIKMYNIILHEIGHNMGLTHCVNSSCIMSEASGSSLFLIKKDNDYCKECKRKIIKLNPGIYQ